MLRILGRKNSVNVIKVLWCAEELGLAFEQTDLGGPFGGTDTPEFRAMNPMGKVPVIDDDGVVLWESHTIVRYLAARYGRGALSPEDPAARAQAEIWMDWALAHLHGPVTTIFWNLVRYPEERRDPQAVAEATREAAELWAVLDRHLSGRRFVAGDELTVGDIPAGAQAYRWYSLVEDRPRTPHLDAWYARLAERPAYRRHAMQPLS